MRRDKVTQTDLASIIGGAQSTVSAWLKGKAIPPADIAVRIAKQFRVSVEYLIEGDAEYTNIAYIPLYKDKTPPEMKAGIANSIPIDYSFIMPYDPGSVRMVKAAGDSMIEIHLFPGDMVFFVPDDNPSDGLYVVGIEDKLLIKQVEFNVLKHEVRLISKNGAYPDQVLKNEDTEKIKIVGKVLGWITRHPF